MINWTLEGKKVGSVRTTMILKKSEAAIHILPEQDVARYVHEEIKPSPTTVKAKVEEEVRGKKSLGKKRVQKEDEAYEKLVMLNEAYEQALVARGVDILAIKAETEKKFAEEKRIRQNKGEPQIDEALSEGDQTREMDIELEELICDSSLWYVTIVCLL
ncbi:uncharacterized protein LOC109845812 [Asparagus officinalis]|uniref:uncharacterized protein LOC109845812 n=1 Tax=Asparagus officinalis TaxID=4686 RepID=UPI00098DF224|nr:uncharacterized protein LOC109845812 [Asparagus officinalis]